MACVEAPRAVSSTARRRGRRARFSAPRGRMRRRRRRNRGLIWSTLRPTTESPGSGETAACRLRTAAAHPPTRRRTFACPPVGSDFERRTVTTTSSPSARSTSVQQRATTSLRRRAPWKSRATMAPSIRPRRSAVFGRSRPRPVRRGRRQVARTVAHSSAVRPRAWPRRGGASPAAVRRNPSIACLVNGPTGTASPASLAARVTAATAIAAVAGDRPVWWRCPT